ncbi:hypothetical protein Patl1_14613 [Pistacia atlantica]|uniref:Uncharacterized protein n=1 Tax=Pistacia atlantica TaxID=434234 RepID=A0ACC1AVE4_9ROSI|nr:hypothetical protein Patl1_14613 [Pistacia atlantica]
MEIHVKKTSVVRPAQQTPSHSLEMSNLDLLNAHFGQVPLVYFYRRPAVSERSDFFDTSLLKEALSKALVAFYPLAGRLKRDENGRLHIECNAEGVLFVEAETSCVIDDEFGDDNFTPSLKMRQLVPSLDYSSKNISSSPLLVSQFCYLFTSNLFQVWRGLSWRWMASYIGRWNLGLNFIKSWAEITSGFSITNPPFIDRTILKSRTPPYPTFDHIEYHPPPELQSGALPTSMTRVELSLDRINFLKKKFKEDYGVTYSTYEILAAHVWRCVCKARGLPNDQATKLYIPTNGRLRFNPPLPLGYLGNAVFIATPIVLADDIRSKPLIYAVKIIREVLKQMDDEYLRSALAYVEKHYDDLTALKQGAPTCKCPNLRIVSLGGMPIYDTNFGWGSPIYMGWAIVPFEGQSFILPSPSNERILSLIICLETRHMELFKKFFYSEGVGSMKKYYKPSAL